LRERPDDVSAEDGTLLREALPVSTRVVAIDPGKVSNRVRLSTGEAGSVVHPL
jgi:transposase